MGTFRIEAVVTSRRKRALGDELSPGDALSRQRRCVDRSRRRRRLPPPLEIMQRAPAPCSPTRCFFSPVSLCCWTRRISESLARGWMITPSRRKKRPAPLLLLERGSIGIDERSSFSCTQAVASLSHTNPNSLSLSLNQNSPHNSHRQGARPALQGQGGAGGTGERAKFFFFVVDVERRRRQQERRRRRIRERKTSRLSLSPPLL